MSRKINFFKDSLFKPSVLRSSGGRESLSISDSAQDSYGAVYSSSSFRFDPAGAALKNTQQLNVDFSKFENHTFFNSAKNKVHVAFEKIINQYPFDGTRSEYESFFDKITGFEKYVFDRFPKNTGFLIFDRDGSSPGTFLSVDDSRGSGDLESDRKYDGQPRLKIGENPFTIELNIFVPSGSVNHNEVIAQRLSQGAGYTLALSSSSESDSPEGECQLVFILSDGSKSESVKKKITKGKFHHIAAIYDRGDTNRLKIVRNFDSTTQSTGSIILDTIDFKTTNMLIGSGSKHSYGNLSFEPKQTLSGALDEFRFFLSSRTRDDLKKYGDREIFAQEDLQLYFRFNEPSGSYNAAGLGTNNLCLDHSGNGFHTQISNFDISQRDTSRIGVDSIVAEDPSVSPVLFPTFESVRSLSSELLSSASNYDLNNPNLITNLVPRHYLSDEQNVSSLEDEVAGNLEGQPRIIFDQPGGNEIQQSHLITSILYMWAETFDEIKMFIDELSRMTKVDYDSKDTISDNMLSFLAEYHSFNLPSQFNQSSILQFQEGRNVTLEKAQKNRSLQEIQNTIWRRILSDLPEIRRTKGTRSSLEALLRNVGINPGTTFRIKEYGGSPRKEISNTYEKRTHIGSRLNFSSSFSPQGTLDAEGRDSNRPVLTTPFLSASRVEPGEPLARGVFINGVSNQKGDGLFTSSSWTSEAFFSFNGSLPHTSPQSLMRIHTTGSSSGTGNNWLTFNLTAVKPNPKTAKTGSLILFGKPDGNKEGNLRVEINNIDVFNGGNWYISFGREAKSSKNNYASSSYFLRAGQPRYLKSPLFRSSSAFFDDTGDNTMNSVDSSYNASGSFVCFGSMSLGYDGSSALRFLNHDSSSNRVDFTGNVSNFRFFSKALSKKESIAHAENPKSFGTIDPSVHFSFNEHVTGSFQRLRVEYSMNQPSTGSSSSGEINITDFSQNNRHGRGTGFIPSSRVVDPVRYDHRTISPKLDTRSSDNKVRIRSYLSPELAETEGSRLAPVYEIPLEENPNDDRRVEIEVSTVQALNDDIILLFSTLDYFDNAIGDPELVFASEYKSLRDLRRIYFNRLTDKMSLMKFFSFFKWFDDTVGDVLEDLVPRSSKYMGANFIIESHSLERPKFTYAYTDMYLGELERPNPGEIFVQQLIGILKKR
jgi:hypothetical protein